MTPSKTARSPAFVTVFDDAYNQPDCRMYARMMDALGYTHHDHAVPVFLRAMDALCRVRGLEAPRVFDFASSYGFVTAMLTRQITSRAFLARYRDPEFDALGSGDMILRDRAWLAELPRRLPAAHVAGLDVCANAVAYGRKVGLFDQAFSEDLQTAPPSAALADCLARTDIIVECGSVAHLMPRALDRILSAAGPKKPWVITSPVRGNERAQAFEILRAHGLSVEPLGGPFPHRRFDSPEEQARATAIARAAGHDTAGLEDEGHFYAQVYLSRPEDEQSARVL